MLTVAIPKRNKLQNIIVLTPKDGAVHLSFRVCAGIDFSENCRNHLKISIKEFLFHDGYFLCGCPEKCLIGRRAEVLKEGKT